MKNRCLSIIFFSLLLCSCNPEKAQSQGFSVVNWNLQTFFDGTKDGTEYSEFKKNSAWGKEAYSARLLKLCSAINLMNADIFVFEEIENSKILYDISNQLAGKSWNGKNNWSYACFSKNPEDAIGCGIISRLPIVKTKIHNMDIRTEGKTQPSMRPIMQVDFLVGFRTVTIFVNHWKSKSGGEEESEIWRDWQESSLCRLLSECKETPSLACGDFNRDIKEFFLKKEWGTDIIDTANIVLREKLPLEKQGERNIDVFSPWIMGSGNIANPGSYFFDDRWERIDHFFSNDCVALGDFCAVVNELWCGENDIPKAYKIYSGTGWSDHLPIRCRVRVK